VGRECRIVMCRMLFGVPISTDCLFLVVRTSNSLIVHLECMSSWWVSVSVQDGVGAVPTSSNVSGGIFWFQRDRVV